LPIARKPDRASGLVEQAYFLPIEGKRDWVTGLVEQALISLINDFHFLYSKASEFS
jgi:hypothetical protein